MDYSIIAAAGLSQSDFATLTGLSRITINSYVNHGKEPRDKFGSQYPLLRVKTALNVLQKLVASEKLPLRDLHFRGRPTADAKARKARVMGKIKALVDNQFATALANE